MWGEGPSCETPRSGQAEGVNLVVWTPALSESQWSSSQSSGVREGKKRQREEGFHIWFFLSCSFSLSLSHAHCFFCNSDVKPTKGSWQQVPQSMLVWLYKISSWLIRTPAVLEVLHSWMSESASQAEVAFFGLFLFPDGFFEHLSSFGLQETRSEWLVTENLGTANQLN